MKCLLSAICLFALPVALPAQDAEPQALTVKTTSAQVAEEILSLFDSDADVPEIAEGSYLTIGLDDGGGMILKTVEGESGWLELEARPVMLMELFEDSIDEGRQMAQMVGGMGLGQAGIAAGDINTVISAAFDFPLQIETLKVSCPVEPTDSYAFDASIEVVAVDGTWLGKLLADTQPNQSGVRTLDASDAMIAVISNVHFPSLVKHLEPILDIVAGIGMDTDEERKESLDFMLQANAAYDGTASIVIDAESRSRSIAGLLDSSVIPKLWNNERFVELQKLHGEINDMMEMTITPRVFKYQDVDVHKMVIEFDTPEMAGPFAEDGKQTTFMAVAGKYAVSASSKNGTEALIDEALDGEAKRTKIKSLATATIDLDSLLDMFMDLTQGQMPPIDEEIPAKLKIVANKKGKALVIGVHAK